MIAAYLTKLFGPIAAEADPRPSFRSDDLWLCFPVGEAPALPDQVEIACHDCGAAIVDQTTSPREPLKLCIGCVGARTTGGRA